MKAKTWTDVCQSGALSRQWNSQICSECIRYSLQLNHQMVRNASLALSSWLSKAQKVKLIVAFILLFAFFESFHICFLFVSVQIYLWRSYQSDDISKCKIDKSLQKIALALSSFCNLLMKPPGIPFVASKKRLSKESNHQYWYFLQEFKKQIDKV